MALFTFDRSLLAALQARLATFLRHRLRDAMRCWPLLVFFLITFAVTATLNPAKVGLTVYGLSKIAAGLFMGYWGDRVMYPYARPHALTGIEAGTAWKRRAALVAACVIAAALIP